MRFGESLALMLQLILIKSRVGLPLSLTGGNANVSNILEICHHATSVNSLVRSATR